MKVNDFMKEIKAIGIHTFIGVPDSTLQPLCSYLNSGMDKEIQHFVPANEGAAVGMAVGHFAATNQCACVYMQNSGLGNVVNPVTSLANEKVYGIPMLFIIGWRGEPGKHDEPQHRFMGEITLELLDLLEITYAVIDENTTESTLKDMLGYAKEVTGKKKQFAIVVKRGSFEKSISSGYDNPFSMVREEAVSIILEHIEDADFIVSTTGKISREVYEQSERIKGQHAQEFLTVGGMGHTSMIAFGIADARPDKKVYCLDGDGSVLMHMGSLAFIGSQKPHNLVHICINNEAHESVGGMPTGAVGEKYYEVAKSCGYEQIFCVENTEQLHSVMEKVRHMDALVFIEVRVSMAARSDLGRPKETAEENKNKFMKYHGAIK